ncbi:MAG: hypothetical protein K6E51_06560 [Treponema sp.]|nr:hypothetical protein [Treponema sp.]
METIILTDLEQIKQAVRLFQISDSISFEVKNDSRLIALVWKDKDTFIGIITGCMADTGDGCLITLLYLEKLYRTADLIRRMVRLFFDVVQERFCVHALYWRYVHCKEKDPYHLILREIPGIELAHELLVNWFLLDLHSLITANKRISDCTEDLLRQKGAVLIPYAGCTQDMYGQLSVLKDADKEVQSLLPFNGMQHAGIEGMFCVSAKDKTLFGWMNFHEADAKTMEINRFYILPEYRPKGIGMYFAGCMIHQFSKQYVQCRFAILTKNTAMQYFVRHFLGAYSQESIETCMSIRINEAL